jgi:hypothetical protein
LLALWHRTPAAERQKFFDAIGRDGVLLNIPASWKVDAEIVRPSDWKPVCPVGGWSDGFGNDLEMPAGLQRKAAHQ